MSKQVLKNGKYNAKICEACGCEFAFEKTDIIGDNIVTCPQCDAECKVEIKK